MDWQKILRVLEICLPVFGLIGLGKALQLAGWMNAGHREFINRLVYYFCLPALIFIKVAVQDPGTFINLALLAGVLLPLLATTAVFLLLAFLLRMKGSFAAAFIFGAFYSNTAYMGFPLAEETYGGAGIAAAALINTVCIPAFMVVAFALIGYYGAGGRVESPWQRLRRMILNPFILACVLGVAAAVIRAGFVDDAGEMRAPLLLTSACDIFAALLNMVAQMGLPLSLVAIGGVLHIGSIRRSLGALALDLAGKLVLIPALGLLVFAYMFPDASPTIAGTTVLLHATPNAVVSYVIACQIGVDEGFVSAQMVLSTVFSALTIPVWIYILL